MAEDDLYSPAKDYIPRTCEIGTVGWFDQEEHVDFGTAENDGHTLIRVTLFAGKMAGEAITPGVAQGRQILVHMNALAGMRVPPKGMHVFVQFPAGMEFAPGAGVIIAGIEKTFERDQLAKDRVVLDFGEDVHVIIKGKSVSLSDHENRFMTVGTPRAGGDPGLIFNAADGSGGAIAEGKVGWWVADGGDAKTIFQMTVAEVKCTKKTGGYWCVDSDGFTGFGANASLRGAAVYLGSLPTAASRALYGVAAGAAAGASASVFVSIT